MMLSEVLWFSSVKSNQNSSGLLSIVITSHTLVSNEKVESNEVGLDLTFSPRLAPSYIKFYSSLVEEAQRSDLNGDQI